jgi:membrane protein YdbS with pleckstrin-like domain
MQDDTAGAADAVGWRRLDPQSVPVGRIAGAMAMLITGLGSLLALTIVWLVGDGDVPIGLALAGLVLLLGVMAWLTWIMPERRYRYTRYRLDHLGLLIHRGRLFHSELGVLRARIQHTDVTQGPIQRTYGLATLSISTAGSDEGQIGLSGIQIDEARRLRTELTGLVGDDVV